MWGWRRAKQKGTADAVCPRIGRGTPTGPVDDRVFGGGRHFCALPCLPTSSQGLTSTVTISWQCKLTWGGPCVKLGRRKIFVSATSSARPPQLPGGRGERVARPGLSARHERTRCPERCWRSARSCGSRSGRARRALPHGRVVRQRAAGPRRATPAILTQMEHDLCARVAEADSCCFPLRRRTSTRTNRSRRKRCGCKRDPRGRDQGPRLGEFHAPVTICGWRSRHSVSWERSLLSRRAWAGSPPPACGPSDRPHFAPAKDRFAEFESISICPRLCRRPSPARAPAIRATNAHAQRQRNPHGRAGSQATGVPKRLAHGRRGMFLERRSMRYRSRVTVHRNGTALAPGGKDIPRLLLFRGTHPRQRLSLGLEVSIRCQRADVHHRGRRHGAEALLGGLRVTARHMPIRPANFKRSHLIFVWLIACWRAGGFFSRAPLRTAKANFISTITSTRNRRSGSVCPRDSQSPSSRARISWKFTANRGLVLLPAGSITSSWRAAAGRATWAGSTSMPRFLKGTS